MINSLGVIATKGLSSQSIIVEIITKQSFVEIIGVIQDRGGGIVNVFFKGEIGQINEAIRAIERRFRSGEMNGQCLKIGNFDFSALGLFISEEQ